VARYPSQFTALAALPLQAPDACVAELDRAVTQLGLRGALLFSNINGTALSDPSFWPLYARTEELGVPLFVHPITPVNIDAMQRHRLVPVVGFLFDTSLAALELVYAGVMERFPKLRIVLGNLGGTIPYIAGRADLAYTLYPELQGTLKEMPSTYLRRMYFETAGMPDVEAVMLAIRFAGADHVLLGTDYPQQIADVSGTLRMIQSLPIEVPQQERIPGLNAAALLSID